MVYVYINLCESELNSKF